MLEDLWIRYYLNKKFGNEEKRDDYIFRIWKMDQTLHIRNIIAILNKEANNGTFRVKGTVLTRNDLEGKNVGDFTCTHYKFLLEVVPKELDWYLS